MMGQRFEDLKMEYGIYLELFITNEIRALGRCEAHLFSASFHSHPYIQTPYSLKESASTEICAGIDTDKVRA
jgi:hypothetical protein